METHRRKTLDTATEKHTNEEVRFSRPNVDIDIEKLFLTGLILKTEFIEKILPVYQKRGQHLRSPSVVAVSKWIIEYHKEYGKAPGKHVQDIFNDKRRRLKDEVAEWMRNFLVDLDGKYGQDYKEGKDFNPKYAYDTCVEYLSKQELIAVFGEAHDLAEDGKVDQAKELLSKYESAQSTEVTSSLAQLKAIAVDIDDFLKEHIEPPLMVIEPWLTDRMIFEIFADKGVGKTYLALTIAVLLTRETVQGRKLGPYWKATYGSGVLYVDGEMDQFEMQERLQQIKDSFGPSSTKFPLTLLSTGRLVSGFSRQINLAEKEWRDAITSLLLSGNYHILILDNVAALTQGIDENSKQEWEPINQWLIFLKLSGIASGFLHHPNKKGAQRGTSSRDDNIDVILKLSKPQGYKSSDGVYFTVEYQKTRNIPPSRNLNPFTIRLAETVDGTLEWKERKQIAKTEKDNLIVALILDGKLMGKEIAKKAGVKPPAINYWKTKLTREGLLDRKLKCATLAGEKWLTNQDIDLTFYYENEKD